LVQPPCLPLDTSGPSGFRSTRKVDQHVCFVAAGWSMAIFALAYWAVEVKGWGKADSPTRKIVWPWLVFGSNAIAAYMVSELIPASTTSSTSTQAVKRCRRSGGRAFISSVSYPTEAGLASPIPSPMRQSALSRSGSSIARRSSSRCKPHGKNSSGEKLNEVPAALHSIFLPATSNSQSAKALALAESRVQGGKEPTTTRAFQPSLTAQHSFRRPFKARSYKLHVGNGLPHLLHQPVDDRILIFNLRAQPTVSAGCVSGNASIRLPSRIRSSPSSQIHGPGAQRRRLMQSRS